MTTFIPRALETPNPVETGKSFFLWGARQTGKSYLLRQRYPAAHRIDLLKSDEYLHYAEAPSRLRDLVNTDPGGLYIIDEVQKVPELLDEVHYLIEERKTNFVMCGSSARKLKRGGGNLLGGRAHRYELTGLSRKEIGVDFDLNKYINYGNLPAHYLSNTAQEDLKSYVADYLKEEIAAEALVRNLPRFMDFLRAAAICDTEPRDFTKIASECGVSRGTAGNHYAILVDTLMGFFLPAYVKRQKRRVLHADKFYFANVGVVNQLAKRRNLEPGSELFGKAFENWLINEVRTFSLYFRKDIELSYWRLASGGEVDLIVNDCEHAIEFKSVKRVAAHHLKGLREFRKDNPKTKTLTLVTLDYPHQKTEDQIEILPAALFLDFLWQNRWS